MGGVGAVVSRSGTSGVRVGFRVRVRVGFRVRIRVGLRVRVRVGLGSG